MTSPGDARSPTVPTESRDYRALIELAYQTLLGRDVEPTALAERVAALNGDISFADMFVEIATSEEARGRAQQNGPGGGQGAGLDAANGAGTRNALLANTVAFAYTHFLKRKPTAEDTTFWVGHLQSRLSVEAFIDTIAESDEARFKARQDEVSSDLSDGEFIVAASDVLFGRGLMPTEVVAWQRRLETSDETRLQLVAAIVGDRIRAASRVEQPIVAHDPDLCSLMGTSRVLTRKQWQERVRGLGPVAKRQSAAVPLAERQFSHSGSFTVSMIASLYKGGKFIVKFLDNITSQTLFDRSELIIVDADSPERERETIEAYQKVYPNIVYKRINYRLGIYDAWNVGVELSRGRYLTNTNLDDLRRRDSIALQAATLDAEPDVDAVYQDFYYSFDADLDFDQVAACGFKSELPIITPHNLLEFNSPHNAPMWRRSLHADLGLFDTRYKSAGDYEFWARCMTAGKTFRKINTPHVVYFQNPEGISTRPDTQGVNEAQDILRRYGKELTSATLLQSRRDLLSKLGADEGGAEVEDKRSYYAVVQDLLLNLGASRTAPARLNIEGRRRDERDAAATS